MNSIDLESKWQKLRGEIRSQWGKLTDDDLERIAGNKDKLIGAVQERYGYVWDEARQMVDRYLDDYNGLKTRATEALKLSWCGLDGALEPMNPIFTFSLIAFRSPLSTIRPRVNM